MRKHISWDCSFKDSTHLVMGLQVAWSRREIVEETHTYQCSFKDSTHLVMGLQVARSRREQSVMQTHCVNQIFTFSLSFNSNIFSHKIAKWHLSIESV